MPFNSKNKWMASVFKQNESYLPSLNVPGILADSPKQYSESFDFDARRRAVVAVKGQSNKIYNDLSRNVKK